MDTIQILEKSLQIPAKSIRAVLELLEQGSTIPFIARYRKEMTGSLDEETLRQIEQQYQYQEHLLRKKEDTIRLIEEKGLLTPSLKEAILNADKLSQVEDLYRPFKEKRKTKATEAIAAGLSPLAQAILKDNTSQSLETLAASYAASAGMSVEKALEGAGYILAQQFGDDPALRHLAKSWLVRKTQMKTALKKGAEDPAGKYQIYHEFSSDVSKLKPHQILAINRAEEEKVLSVSLDGDTSDLLMRLERQISRPKNPQARPFVSAALQDAWKRLMQPSLVREIRRDLKEAAEASSIVRFQDNLEHLLLQKPLGKCRVLGFDPAFRTGCKLAVLSENSDVLHIDVIYPHQPVNRKKEAAQILSELIRKYKIQYIAIGNGTASRESEAFVASVLKDFPGVQYALVSEAGASVYSASDLARSEFPDLTVEKRSAISIGRRIQDPLSELVKIPPQSIGIGEYQHDVNQKQLKEALDFTTEKVVNQVGVNINTASPSILGYISGLNKTTINKLLQARSQSPITSRSQIGQIKGISDKVYEQCIGFIRVPASENPLDSTGIHPESYPQAQKVAQILHLDLQNMHSPEFHKAVLKARPQAVAKAAGISEILAKDILQELAYPALDPREKLDGPSLKSDVLDIKDLKEGMALEGVIRNVTSFGAFADIGLHNDGLIHISKLADRFVKDPNEIVHTGQIVTCYVCGIDKERKRVSLSLLRP